MDRLKVISSHPWAVSFAYMNLDILDRESMQALFSDYNFAVVVNLAEQSRALHSLDNPHVHIDTKVIGFGDVL